MNQKDIVLSVIVVIVSDTVGKCCDLSHLTGCLQSLVDQVEPPTMEIIVPYPKGVQGIDEVKKNFPHSVFLEVDDLNTYTGIGGSREHHDELRARGIAASSGRLIALLEDHARPDGNWSRNVANAHTKGYAAIGGAIENGIDRPLNWAVYFCDFGKYQNPVQEGESQFASDANVSYKREVLENVTDIWQTAFHEPEVNWAIKQKGGLIALSPDVIVYQYRKGLNLEDALKERYIWGRSYALTRRFLLNSVKRIAFVFAAPFLPILLSFRLLNTILKKQRNQWVLIKSFPLIVLLTLFWSFGELSGYMTLRNPGTYANK